MPRGRYVNHKGRHRKFTEPEELQKQSEEESTEEEFSSEDDDSKPKSVKSCWWTAIYSNEESEESEEDGDTRKKDKGVASLIKIKNTNRQIKKLAVKIENVSLDAKPQLSRREYRLIHAHRYYEKLRAQNKTNQAKADLARLAVIRQQRAETAAKREAEKKAAEERKTVDQSNLLKHQKIKPL